MCTAKSVQCTVYKVSIFWMINHWSDTRAVFTQTLGSYTGAVLLSQSGSNFTSHTEDLGTTSVRNSSTNWSLFIFQLYKLKVINGRTRQSSTGFAWLIELLRNITIILAGWSSQLYSEKLILTTFVPHKVNILIFIESHSVFTCSAGFSLQYCWSF